ncbi:MAG: spore coat associated protein CotJA [Eubacteriales bacterium]|nr:spore coat associated protein CotJA [Eubacteriales bacterium]
MENYQMGRSCGRPYRTTCGMNRMPASERIPMPKRMSAPERMSARTSGQCECERNSTCNCHMPGMAPKEAELYAKADMLPPAMGYVPCQKFTRTFDLCYALQAGTVFPELCKPFCGKRGARR